MNRQDVLGLEPLSVEMQPEGGQQEHVQEGVEVAYVGCHMIAEPVAEAGDDRLSADE